MREIVLDTETTGLDPAAGHRIVEIGAVELLNQVPTGRVFHHYINPQGRPVHPDALAVHGIGEDKLRGKPVFAEIADDFIAFIEGAHLVAHNANFDMGFINAEFRRLGHPPVDGARVVDTLQLARRKHPMGPNSLDALCRRYGIDNSRRTKHGALLDSEILAEVYIELIGGKQASLGLGVGAAAGRPGLAAPVLEKPQRIRPLAPRLDAAAIQAHETFILNALKAPLWKGYLGITDEAAQ